VIRLNNYLSVDTISKLQLAYAHEIRNMMIYEQISSWLDVSGFKNLSKYYADWSMEEKSHSIMVKDFLSKLNVPIMNTPFDYLAFSIDNTSITNFAKKTLETENETTKIYDDLLQTALDFEDSSLLVDFATKMNSEQLEETGKANDIHDMIMNIGENKAMLQLFDNTFEG